MRSLIARLFRKAAPVEEEVRPSRRDRRRIAKIRPAERQAKFLATAIRKQERKRKRGYKAAHVRTREVYDAGVKRGVDMTLRAMTKRLKDQEQRRKWLPRIVSRMGRAA